MCRSLQLILEDVWFLVWNKGIWKRNGASLQVRSTRGICFKAFLWAGSTEMAFCKSQNIKNLFAATGTAPAWKIWFQLFHKSLHFRFLSSAWAILEKEGLQHSKIYVFLDKLRWKKLWRTNCVRGTSTTVPFHASSSPYPALFLSMLLSAKTLWKSNSATLGPMVREIGLQIGLSVHRRALSQSLLFQVWYDHNSFSCSASYR